MQFEKAKSRKKLRLALPCQAALAVDFLILFPSLGSCGSKADAKVHIGMQLLVGFHRD